MFSEPFKKQCPYCNGTIFLVLKEKPDCPACKNKICISYKNKKKMMFIAFFDIAALVLMVYVASLFEHSLSRPVTILFVAIIFYICAAVGFNAMKKELVYSKTDDAG